MTIFAAVLIFSFIVIIHELGHFLAAKKAGIEVVEFSLGMGPRLLSYRGRQTRYSLKLLPIGGSCMMKGEDNEESEEGSFNSKSVWARLSVIVAGPLFNFILAFVMALILTANVGWIFPWWGPFPRAILPMKREYRRATGFSPSIKERFMFFEISVCTFR